MSSKTFPRFLTAGKLTEIGACLSEVNKFKAEWPEGAEFTLDNLLRGADLELNMEWLAEEVLEEAHQQTFEDRVDTLYMDLCVAQRALSYSLSYPQEGALYPQYLRNIARVFHKILTTQLEEAKA